jgi:hypothetical protein
VQIGDDVDEVRHDIALGLACESSSDDEFEPAPAPAAPGHITAEEERAVVHRKWACGASELLQDAHFVATRRHLRFVLVQHMSSKLGIISCFRDQARMLHCITCPRYFASHFPIPTPKCCTVTAFAIQGCLEGPATGAMSLVTCTDEDGDTTTTSVQ